MRWAQVNIDLGSAFAVSFLSKTAPCWDADTLATRNIRHENPDECAAHLSRVLYCQKYALSSAREVKREGGNAFVVSFLHRDAPCLAASRLGEHQEQP